MKERTTWLVVSFLLTLLQFGGCNAQDGDNEIEVKLDANNKKVAKHTEDEVAPDSCSYTFHVTGNQLSRYCARVPGSSSRQLEDMKRQLDAVVTDNNKMKADLDEIKKKCDVNGDAIKKIKKETEAWRQIIHWPQIKDNINPGNLSEIIDKEREYTDCLEAYKSGKTKKGIYKIKPKGAADGFMGFCDEGWTVIQRRFDGHTSFEREWYDYASGFGELSGEFWLGNDRLNTLTSDGDTELQFEGVNWKGKLYRVTHDDFQVGDEESLYEFSVGNKTSGNYKDVLTKLNGRKFSTRDRDNDEWGRGNCARHYRLGWWLGSCGWSPNHEYCDGITCMRWGGIRLKKSQLKIRPKQA